MCRLSAVLLPYKNTWKHSCSPEAHSLGVQPGWEVTQARTASARYSQELGEDWGPLLSIRFLAESEGLLERGNFSSGWNLCGILSRQEQQAQRETTLSNRRRRWALRANGWWDWQVPSPLGFGEPALDFRLWAVGTWKDSFIEQYSSSTYYVSGTVNVLGMPQWTKRKRTAAFRELAF